MRHFGVSVGVGLTLACVVSAAPRDVQIRSVNFATGVVELYNFGASNEALDGWQWCTHDENQSRQYSATGGMNGLVAEPGTSVYVHFANDAPADPDHRNIATIGGQFALPLDNGAFGMGIYFPPAIFPDGQYIADHLQWNLGGADNAVADERSDEAVAGGVWTAEEAWIPTAASTTYIRLSDPSGAILHGPKNYDVLDTMPDCNSNGIDDVFDIAAGAPDVNHNDVIDTCECIADISGDGTANGIDVGLFLQAYANMQPNGDINADGLWNGIDVGLFLQAYAFALANGCP